MFRVYKIAKNQASTVLTWSIAGLYFFDGPRNRFLEKFVSSSSGVCRFRKIKGHEELPAAAVEFDDCMFKLRDKAIVEMMQSVVDAFDRAANQYRLQGRASRLTTSYVRQIVQAKSGSHIILRMYVCHRAKVLSNRPRADAMG